MVGQALSEDVITRWNSISVPRMMQYKASPPAEHLTYPP